MIKSYSSSSEAETFRRQVLDELQVSDSEQALQLLRRLKRHLSRYFRERKTLRRLGLDDLDDVLRVMRAMKNRVSALQDQVEAHEKAQDKLHAIQEALDVDASPEQTVATITSISNQLESLYEEKEALSEVGLSDAGEAVEMIQSMQEQLSELYGTTEEDSSEAEVLERLERELGVSDPESILEMVDDLEAPLSDIPSEVPDEWSSRHSMIVRTLDRQLQAAQGANVSIPTDEGVPLLSADARSSLPGCSQADLDALPVGAVALDDGARIQMTNEHTPSFPGLHDASAGASFFDCVAPVRNPLLQRPLQDLDRPLDTYFVYTVSRPDAAPRPFQLHLYRSPEAPLTWMLYDAL